MRAILATSPGGPDVLTLADLPDPVPGEGEALVRVAAAGVNFIDTYRRAGTYPMPFPHVVGSEGAGEVVALGPGTPTATSGSGIAVGDRVAWSDAPGSYAELVTVPVERLLPVPEGVGIDVAAALPLQGMTAHYLSHATYPVRPGDVALVHAGAGGVGLLLTQLVRARGGRVISTVSTTEKEALALAAGAEHVIRYDRLTDLPRELPALVRQIAGDGAHVVYDGVGRATFDASLASLRVRGMLVLFGGASGQVPPFDLQRLNASGSLYVTRPTLGDYTRTREELLGRAADLFDAVAADSLNVRIGARYPLAEAAAAHRALESRATTGKVLLEA